MNLTRNELTRRIPSSKCPNLECGRIHHFQGVDMSDAPIGSKDLGPGAVIVCQSCCQVNMIGNNKVLQRVDDPNFLASDPIREERWRVLAQNPDMEAPADLIEAEAAATGTDLILVKEPEPEVSYIAVLPTEGDLIDYGYTVSVTSRPGVEMVITGIEPSAAELIFRVIHAAWDMLIEAQIEPGQRFTLDPDTGYQYVLCQLPDTLIGELGLPEHDGEYPDQVKINYLQVLWMDEHGRWPWEENGSGAPVIASPWWRPNDLPVAELRFGGRIQGAVDVDESGSVLPAER